jgi:hypothetical protein
MQHHFPGFARLYYFYLVPMLWLVVTLFLPLTKTRRVFKDLESGGYMEFEDKCIKIKDKLPHAW